MKKMPLFVVALLALAVSGCAVRRATEPAESTGKGAIVARQADSSAGETDDWDDVADVQVHDPIEPVNRGVFWFNHQLYTLTQPQNAPTVVYGNMHMTDSVSTQPSGYDPLGD